LVETVTVSSKGQVTIPAGLRRELGIMQGERLIAFREGKALKMVPVPRLSQLAGVDREVFRGRRPSEEVEKTRREWTEDFERRVREA